MSYRYLSYYTSLSFLQAEEAPKKEEKPERPKSPGFLAKILAPFKNGEKKTEKKVKEKTEKSKKSEKKEEVRVVVWLPLSSTVWLIDATGGSRSRD